MRSVKRHLQPIAEGRSLKRPINVVEELQRVKTFELAGGEFVFGQGTVTTAMQINRIRNGASEKIQ